MPGKEFFGRMSSVVARKYIGSNVMPSYVLVYIFFSKGAPLRRSMQACFHSS